VSRWTCPRYDREFGNANQSHTCIPGCTAIPGCTVDTSFVGAAWQILRY
jgi:hypothetical protein